MSTETLIIRMLRAALFATAQIGNNPNSHYYENGKFLNIYAMESYSAIKRNENLIYSVTWIKFEDVIQGRVSRHKHTYSVCMIPFTGISRKSKTNLR